MLATKERTMERLQAAHRHVPRGLLKEIERLRTTEPHPTRDRYRVLVCPVLRAQKCSKCGGYGHTPSRCTPCEYCGIVGHAQYECERELADSTKDGSVLTLRGLDADALAKITAFVETMGFVIEEERAGKYGGTAPEPTAEPQSGAGAFPPLT